MIEDWKEQIVTMVYVKQALHEVDESNLWPWHLPNVATTEEQLKVVEEYLGHNLDSRYKLFLKQADGWQGFYQTVDLFGTEQLLGGSKMSYATMLLDVLDEESVLKASGFAKNDLLPIAVTTSDKDLFVITCPHSVNPGVVIWFAGYEIDRFPSFDEYFLAMIDYNRADYQDLLNQIKAKK